MHQRKRLLKANKKPLDSFDEAIPTQSNPSNLINSIQNQNLYLKLVGIALQLSREAGVTQSALQQVQNKLLGVKGWQEYTMLNQEQIKEIDKVDLQNKKVSYNVSKKYITPSEQISFLTRVQKQVQEVQAKQHVIFALKKYIEQKKKTLIDNITKSQNFTRVKFFIGKTKINLNKKKLQRSNFYGQTLREIIGRISPAKSIPYQIMKRMEHLKTIWGHTFFSQSEEQYCPVYNTIFDNTQKLIISGGDDGKIKVWSRDTGALISTLQGHKDYINKICVSKDNKILLSAAQDSVRFFDLDNMNSMGGYKIQSILDIGEVVQQKTGISNVIFANNQKLFVLPTETIKTQRNRKIQLYDFKIYNFGSRIKSQNTNAYTLTINQQGIIFLGFGQGQIIIFDFNKLYTAQIDQSHFSQIEGMSKISQFVLPVLSILNAHESDILQIKWNPLLSCFSTGAKKDGICKIWQFKPQQSDTKPTLIKQLKIPKYKLKRKKKQYSCNFSIWNSKYTHLTCSFAQHQNQEEQSQNRGDGQVIVYNASRMQVTWQMSKTIDLSSIRAMDNHPFIPNIMVVCDSFGKIIIADIYQNYIINILQQRAFHLNHPSFCLVPSDCKFSQDGLNLLVATQYGNFSIYGYDIKQFYKVYPTQQLFQNDYQQFQIDPLTYKPVLDVNTPIDVNQLTRGQFQNMRHLTYKSIIKINQKVYKKLIQSNIPKQHHKNIYSINLQQIQRINDCYQQYDRNMQIFKQNIEEIQNKRMALLYQQSQSRQLKLKQIITQKIQKIKQIDNNINTHLLTNSFSSQNVSSVFTNLQHNSGNAENNTTAVRRRGRRPTRNLSNNNHNNRTSYRSYEEQSEEDNNQQNYHHRVHNQQQQQYQAQPEQELDQQDYGQSQQDEEFNEDNQSQQIYPNGRARRISRRRLRRNTYTNIQHATRTTRNLRRRPVDVALYQFQQDYEQHYNRISKRRHDQQQEQQIPIQAQQQNQHNYQNKQQPQKKQFRKIVSRSVSQMMRIQKQPCNLCNFKQSTVTCSYCEIKNYCDGCRNYRGKKSHENTKYVCFQCYYNQNQSPQLHKNISCEKYNINQRGDLFIPQIGDEVVYFFQGYQQFLYDKIQILNNKYIKLGNIFDIIPHENQPQLINIIKCTITDIDYALPLQQNNTLTYRNNNNNRGRNRLVKSNIQDILLLLTLRTVSNIQFKIFFTPGYQYLVKWQIYDDIIKNQRYAKFKLFDIVKIKDQQIQIEQVKPINCTYNNSIWKNIIVHKAQNKYLRRSRDKNDDIAINIWNIDGFIDACAFQYHSSMNAAMRQHYKKQILKIQTNQKDIWAIFNQPVDTNKYTNYHNFVEVDMYLRLIVERLDNNYYASQKSFVKDINTLIANSISYNGKQCDITIFAEYLGKLILQGQNMNMNMTINNQYDSTQKKSKSKKKITGSGTNKDNEQPQKTKKRSQIKISKFEQEQPISLRRIKRNRNFDEDQQQDYKGQSQQLNYFDQQSSSDVKLRRTTRNKRYQSKNRKEKENNVNVRMTRSRARN